MFFRIIKTQHRDLNYQCLLKNQLNDDFEVKIVDLLVKYSTKIQGF